MNGVLHAEREGCGKNHLLFLHGLMGCCDDSHPIRAHFRDRFQITSMDLPNHGQSPQMDPCTVHDMAEAVRATMDRMAIRQAVVMGHSLGGRVAMMLASETPERVQGFVSIDMGVTAFRPVHLFLLRACQELPLIQFSRRDELLAALMQSIPSEITCGYLLKNVRRDANGAFFWRVPLEILIRNARAVSDAPPLPASFEKPALFLSGENSSMRIHATRDAILRFFPASQMVVIPHAGHSVQTDAPDALCKAVDAWLPSVRLI